VHLVSVSTVTKDVIDEIRHINDSVAGHNPGTNQLDLGGKLDLDSGFF